MPAHATYPTLVHEWGEFVYSFSGITEVKAGNQLFLTPPHMGLWIAPGTEHTGSNLHASVHCSVYIARSLCDDMPERSCSVLVSPLVRAILDFLRNRRLTDGGDPSDQRLLQVLVDQVAVCPTTGSFVPHTDDPQLEPLLRMLRADPSDKRSLGELAATCHLGERTLMRRCEKSLGMSLTEWRQRLRLVQALPLLRSGRSVESVALDLGYATSSAFIAMFRKLTGETPGKFVGERQQERA